MAAMAAMDMTVGWVNLGSVSVWWGIRCDHLATNGGGCSAKQPFPGSKIRNEQMCQVKKPDGVGDWDVPKLGEMTDPC